MKSRIRLIASLFALASSVVMAEGSLTQQRASAKVAVVEEATANILYLARVREHTKEELDSIIRRVEELTPSAVSDPTFEPVQFILHGDELKFFFRRNYEQYRDLVNRAAQLDALNVIDIKACETWMRFQGEPLSQLPHFVDTVPFGPDEIKHLSEEGYVYF